MTIQQMLFGGHQTVQVTAPDADGLVFLPEPAPASSSVSAGSTAAASGGTGIYTYSWTYVSGDASIAIVGGSTSANCNWTATVLKSATKTAIWRVTVSDGVTTTHDDIVVTLTYTTNS